MVCNECGAQVKTGATECTECGAALPKTATAQGKTQGSARPAAQRTAAPVKSKGFPWATAIGMFIAGVFVGYLVFSGKPAADDSGLPASHPPTGGMGAMGMGGKSAPPLSSGAASGDLPSGHPDISSMMKARDADGSAAHEEGDGHDHEAGDAAPEADEAATESAAPSPHGDMEPTTEAPDDGAANSEDGAE